MAPSYSSWTIRSVKSWFLLVAIASSWSASVSAAPATLNADLVVYGGTSAGVAAAVAAARAGRTVIVVEPQVRVGGMISGGLCKTDIGNRATIGGISAEFFARSLHYYQQTYGPNSAELRSSHEGMFMEPKIAAKIFLEMMEETHKVQVLTHQRITSANVSQSKVNSIHIVDVGDPSVGHDIEGKEFIDASYEGDLMALAGVPYRVGRESSGEYNESLAGMNAGPEQFLGTSDQRTQAYNIRGTITDRPDLRVPFPRPEHYDPADFAMLKQSVIKRKAKKLEDELSFLRGEAQIACGKYDPNIQDVIGQNYAYPDGGLTERRRVYEQTRDYWLGYFYTLQSDPDLPAEFHANMALWGLPKDEYPENGNITPQLYVREGRRMLGVYVLNQNDIQINRFKPDSICMGSYTIDCHPVQRITTPTGTVVEGQLSTGTEPYEVPYRSLVPPNVNNLLVVCTLSTSHVAFGTLRMEPVFMMLGEGAGTAADLALGSEKSVQEIDTNELQKRLKASGIPLEAPYRPVIGITISPPNLTPGQPATISLKEIDVRKPLKEIVWNFDGTGRVQATGPTATFIFPAAKPYQISMRATDVDGTSAYTTIATANVGHEAPTDIELHTAAMNIAEPTGWSIKHGGDEYDFKLYLQTGAEGKKERKEPKAIRLSPELTRKGRYFVSIGFPASAKRAADVPVTVTSADGEKKLTLNEQDASTPFIFKPLGEFRFDAGHTGAVEIGIPPSGDPVAVGGIRCIWLGE